MRHITRKLRLSAAVLAGAAFAGCGRAGPATGTGAAAPAPPATPSDRAAPATTLNLLEHVQVPRDQVQGDFRLVDGALIVPSIPAAHLEVPADTPSAYRLELDVERLAGNGSLNLGLVVGGRRVMLVLEGWNGTLSALNLLDGQSGDNNATTSRRPIFAAGRPVSIDCTVHPRNVSVRCDGQTVIDWQGDSSRLSMDERFFHPRSTSRLIIGGWNAQLRITRLQLTSLSGDPIVVDPPASTPVSPAAPGVSPPPQDGWTMYEAKAYGFTVRMPATPTRQEIEGATQFLADSSHGAYIVTVSQTDRAGLAPRDFIDQVQAGMFDEGERVVRQRFFDLAGAVAAKEVAAVDAENDVIAVRFVLSPTHAYQVFYVGPQDRLDAPETRRFLESFELVPQ